MMIRNLNKDLLTPINSDISFIKCNYISLGLYSDVVNGENRSDFPFVTEQQLQAKSWRKKFANSQAVVLNIKAKTL